MSVMGAIVAPSKKATQVRAATAATSALSPRPRLYVAPANGAGSVQGSRGGLHRGLECAEPLRYGWCFHALTHTRTRSPQPLLQVKLDAARQLNTAMSYLQMQQQQMQAMQAQYTGGQGGKWNVGAAYRPPDTNINLSGSYQQGRTNLQISMVPDEVCRFGA